MSSSAQCPEYWAQACQELAAVDSVMAELVGRYGKACLVSRGDAFGTLARSIVGQQISVKAADSVWRRVVESLVSVAPERVLRTSTETLRSCGLSQRKVEYLQDLAAHFADGSLDVARWPEFDDEHLIRLLCGVRGIGRWTAEMFLIFNLLRPDVFPLDDIGLQRAVAEHYCAGLRPERPVLAALGARWRPWRSVATWYLWRALDPVPVEY